MNRSRVSKTGCFHLSSRGSDGDEFHYSFQLCSAPACLLWDRMMYEHNSSRGLYGFWDIKNVDGTSLTEGCTFNTITTVTGERYSGTITALDESDHRLMLCLECDGSKTDFIYEFWIETKSDNECIAHTGITIKTGLTKLQKQLRGIIHLFHKPNSAEVYNADFKNWSEIISADLARTGARELPSK